LGANSVEHFQSERFYLYIMTVVVVVVVVRSSARSHLSRRQHKILYCTKPSYPLATADKMDIHIGTGGNKNAPSTCAHWLHNGRCNSSHGGFINRHQMPREADELRALGFESGEQLGWWVEIHGDTRLRRDVERKR
jgi:hypothetical protein